MCAYRCCNFGRPKCCKERSLKILKYRDLTIESQCMWNVKTNVIPVIIEATGSISQSFKRYLSNIPGKHEIKELHKTAILSTAHILRKVLMWKYKRFNIGNSVICTVNSCNTVFPRNMVCFRNMGVNTLHKGDDDDDDDTTKHQFFLSTLSPSGGVSKK